MKYYLLRFESYVKSIRVHLFSFKLPSELPILTVGNERLEELFNNHPEGIEIRNVELCEVSEPIYKAKMQLGYKDISNKLLANRLN